MLRQKDGGKANGKKVLIDGQQRVTALMAAIAGKEVLDDDFNKDRIKIAFNPLAGDETKRFAVQDASHLKDKRWIPDISVVFDTEFDSFDFAMKYCEVNEGIKPNEVNKAVTALKGIANRQIGVIELDAALDIDEVTEIFIRINSKGTALSQSDFVMSKMAADTIHAGGLMRKTVDYFCHLGCKTGFLFTMQHMMQNSKHRNMRIKLNGWQKTMMIFTIRIMAICLEYHLCISSEEVNWQIWLVCSQDEILLRRNLEKIL